MRSSLNDERILALAELLQGGVELPPIEVIIGESGWIFVDGRHRAAAHTLLDRKEILALVVERKDPAKMFGRALLANWGGALPPTTNDIRHTVRRMLEAGATSATVRKELSFLPATQLHKYIEDSRGQMKRLKIRQALDAVSDGLRPSEAAEKFEVDLESLKSAISGIKKKFGSGDVGIEAENKSNIKGQMKSANTSITKRLEQLFHYVENAEITHESRMILPSERVVEGGWILINLSTGKPFKQPFRIGCLIHDVFLTQARRAANTKPRGPIDPQPKKQKETRSK